MYENNGNNNFYQYNNQIGNPYYGNVQMGTPMQQFGQSTTSAPGNSIAQGGYVISSPAGQQIDVNQLIACIDQLIVDGRTKQSIIDGLSMQVRQTEDLLQRSKCQHRMKITRRCMETSENGQIVLTTHFDNGVSIPWPLILGVKGPINVCSVNFKDFQTSKDYVMAVLGDHCIVLERRKAHKGEYLFNQFCKHQILFPNEIKTKHIEEALCDYFRYRLDEANCADVCDLHALAGWNSGGIFQYAENSNFFRRFNEPFPVLSKRFNEVKPQKHGIKLYFDMLNRISAKEERMAMMLYPIVGILHSLLDGTPTRLRTVLNCIPSESDDSIWVAACLQVFNRDKLEAIDANMTLTERNQILASSKDEVLLVNAQVSEYEDAYSKKKKKSNISSLSDLVRGKCSPADGATVKSAIAFISDDVMHGNAMNLFLEPFDEDFMEEFVEGHAMEMVLSGVVHFVENHKYDVEQLIRKKRNLADKRLRPLAIAYDILAYFFAGEGITLQEEVQLPEIEELAKLFLDGCDSPEEQVETFIQVVRQGREEFTVYAKGYGGTFREDGVYCTKELVYFPKKVLTGLFERRHELKLMNQVLTHLRATGDLVTDAGSGTTKKLQVGNERVSVYCFKRDLFSRLGDSDFVDIGRRDENA